VLTIRQLRDRSDTFAALSDNELRDLASAITDQLETKLIRRYVGRRIETVKRISATSAAVVCAGHGLVAGDTIRIAGSQNGLDGDVVVASVVNRHEFVIPTAEDIGSVDAEPNASVYVRMTKTFDTAGREELFIHPTPIIEITEIRLREGTTTSTQYSDPIASDSYELRKQRDGVSLTGEVLRMVGGWPVGRKRDVYGYQCGQCVLPAGAKVTFFAGYRDIPHSLIDGVMTLAALSIEAQDSDPASSESLDYYSFSRATDAATWKLPSVYLEKILTHKAAL